MPLGAPNSLQKVYECLYALSTLNYVGKCIIKKVHVIIRLLIIIKKTLTSLL